MHGVVMQLKVSNSSIIGMKNTTRTKIEINDMGIITKNVFNKIFFQTS